MHELTATGRYSPISAEQYKMTEMNDDFTLTFYTVIALAVIYLNTVTAKLTARSADTAMFYIVGKMLSTVVPHSFAYVGNLVSIIS